MKSPKFINFLVFMTGALSSFNISFLGLISLSELLSFIFIPICVFYLQNKFKDFSSNEKLTIFMISVWVIAIILSDFINGTPLNLFFKGIGHPIMILTMFVYFNRILQYSKNFFLYFLSGLVVSSIIYYLTDKTAFEYFRFGILGIILSLVIMGVYLLWKKNRYVNSISLIILFMILSFFTGGRSSAIIIFFVIILLALSYNVYSRKKGISYNNISKLILITFALVLLLQEIYVGAVKNKLFSEEYQTKFEGQLNTGLPLIFSGRTEIYSSLEAIYDSPIIGHGSWSKGLKYTNIYLQKQGFDVLSNPTLNYGFDKIPAHSFFFGAWVEHGFLAAIFFVFLGKRILNLLLFSLNSFKNPETPYLILLCIGNFWHLLFSPLGSDKRIYVALILALNSYYINYNRRREKVNKYYSSQNYNN